MARRFQSGQLISFPVPAALVGVDGGPLTIVLMYKVNTSAYQAPIYTRTSTNAHAWWVEVDLTGGIHANYGTGTTARPVGTQATGVWQVGIFRKGAGGTFYPVGRYLSGTGFLTDSGNITAVNMLIDGSALDSGGKVDFGRWGPTDYSSDVEVASAAVFNSNLADAVVTTFVDWTTVLAATPIYWAAFDGTNVTDSASGSPTTTGTPTSTADPGGWFPSAGTAVNVADTPTGFSLRSGSETVSSGVVVADSPAGVSWRSPEGSGVVSGVQAALDAPNGLRLRSGYEAVASGVSSRDAPNGLRLRSGTDSTTQQIFAPDVARFGWRWGSGAETVSLGGTPVTIADSLPSGYRLRSVGGTAVLGVSVTDLPIGWRFRSAPETISAGVSVTDAPSGMRLRSGYETVSIATGSPTDRPNGWRWGSGGTSTSGEHHITPDVTILAPVRVIRITSSVSGVRIITPVRRFRA